MITAGHVLLSNSKLLLWWLPNIITSLSKLMDAGNMQLCVCVQYVCMCMCLCACAHVCDMAALWHSDFKECRGLCLQHCWHKRLIFSLLKTRSNCPLSHCAQQLSPLHGFAPGCGPLFVNPSTGLITSPSYLP